ncbi:MAG: hypothetical protein LUC98_04250 [Lachnospiraceae bacterium]|nr:hypothetical protein [Lachnospiraceae bacterium]
MRGWPHRTETIVDSENIAERFSRVQSFKAVRNRRNEISFPYRPGFLTRENKPVNADREIPERIFMCEDMRESRLTGAE